MVAHFAIDAALSCQVDPEAWSEVARSEVARSEDDQRDITWHTQGNRPESERRHTASAAAAS